MKTKPRIDVLNGPNLNLLGRRETDIYGLCALSDIEALCRDKGQALGFEILFRQSNHEGEMVEAIHEASDKASGLVLNAAGYSHSSVAILDAVRAAEIPVIEVHISNIYGRESFRRRSMLSPAVSGIVCGLGAYGYALALDALAEKLKARS